jgi:hypothetical protein
MLLVRSYRTFAPLPVPRGPSAVCFCGTVLTVARTGRYPAGLAIGEPGLSSTGRDAAPKTDSPRSRSPRMLSCKFYAQSATEGDEGAPCAGLLRQQKARSEVGAHNQSTIGNNPLIGLIRICIGGRIQKQDLYKGQAAGRYCSASGCGEQHQTQGFQQEFHAERCARDRYQKGVKTMLSRHPRI